MRHRATTEAESLPLKRRRTNASKKTSKSGSIGAKLHDDILPCPNSDISSTESDYSDEASRTLKRSKNMSKDVTFAALKIPAASTSRQIPRLMSRITPLKPQKASDFLVFFKDPPYAARLMDPHWRNRIVAIFLANENHINSSTPLSTISKPLSTTPKSFKARRPEATKNGVVVYRKLTFTRGRINQFRIFLAAQFLNERLRVRARLSDPDYNFRLNFGPHNNPFIELADELAREFNFITSTATLSESTIEPEAREAETSQLPSLFEGVSAFSLQGVYGMLVVRAQELQEYLATTSPSILSPKDDNWWSPTMLSKIALDLLSLDNQIRQRNERLDSIYENRHSSNKHKRTMTPQKLWTETFERSLDIEFESEKKSEARTRQLAIKATTENQFARETPDTGSSTNVRILHVQDNASKGAVNGHPLALSRSRCDTDRTKDLKLRRSTRQNQQSEERLHNRAQTLLVKQLEQEIPSTSNILNNNDKKRRDQETKTPTSKASLTRNELWDLVTTQAKTFQSLKDEVEMLRKEIERLKDVEKRREDKPESG